MSSDCPLVVWLFWAETTVAREYGAVRCERELTIWRGGVLRAPAPMRLADVADRPARARPRVTLLAADSEVDRLLYWVLQPGSASQKIHAPLAE